MCAAATGPALLRLTVPRLQGHSFQDTQTYKSEEFVASEWARDPLPRLKAHLVGPVMSEAEWDALAREAEAAVEAARERGRSAPASPTRKRVTGHVFYDGEMQQRGGQWTKGYRAPRSTETPRPEGQRINMVTAIRRTLERELEINPRVLLFGEDIGPKGGVHAVTLGLQDKFGIDARVRHQPLARRALSAARSAWRWPG